MKRTLITLIILSISSIVFSQALQPNDSIKKFVDYLNNNSFLSPKEYILNSFDKKDIIVLSERLHPEFKQYEMIVDIIKDDKFKGDIYTEVGVFNVGKQINELLKKEGLSEDKVKKEILNIFKSLDYTPLWPMYNYYYLIKSIYETNQQRKPDEKIYLHPLDVVFDWDSVNCAEQYSMFDKMMEPQNGFSPVISRNTIMAEHFIKAYSTVKHHNPNKRKALVILNTYHGYTRIPKYIPNPNEPFIYSTAEYIYKAFPSITKGILINGYSFSTINKFVAKGKWDAAFRITGNKSLGFNLENTPFGSTQFDMYNFGGSDYEKVSFEYMFDGFIFYEPIDSFEIAIGIPNLFNDSSFVEEFYRRTAIAEKIPLNKAKSSKEIKEIIKEYNTLTIENIRYNKYLKQDFEDFNVEINKWINK